MPGIGEKLTYLKRKYHFTTKEVSARSGVPVGTLNKILNGETKSPGLATMEKIAGAFAVPVRYFANDDIPLEYQMGVWAEHYHYQVMSEQEWRVISCFRKLDERKQQMLEAILESLCLLNAAYQKGKGYLKLFCYLPGNLGRQGIDSEMLDVKQITVLNDEVAKYSDFAVVMCGTGMEPLYPLGAILGVRREKVSHGQVGLFIVKGEGYIRTLYQRRGMLRLDTVNCHVPNLKVNDGEPLHCLGRILGPLTLWEESKG